MEECSITEVLSFTPCSVSLFFLPGAVTQTGICTRDSSRMVIVLGMGVTRVAATTVPVAPASTSGSGTST